MKRGKSQWRAGLDQLGPLYVKTRASYRASSGRSLREVSAKNKTNIGMRSRASTRQRKVKVSLPKVEIPG